MSTTHSGSVHIGRTIQRFALLDSTNTLAASYASDPANHGLVIIADAQTAGRGQYQRAWQAPSGSSVLMSVLLFPPPEQRRPALLTAWAAVSVCATIRQTTDVAATIKWPNDVLIDGKKVCGILCEAGVQHIVAGIGLNVRQAADDFEKMGLPDATSLAAVSGNAIDLDGVIVRLIQNLDDGYQRLAKGETAALETAWRDGIGLVGQRVRMEMMDGSEILGHLCEIGFDGIVLRQDEKLTTLRPEAIRHLRAAPSAGVRFCEPQG